MNTVPFEFTPVIPNIYRSNKDKVLSKVIFGNNNNFNNVKKNICYSGKFEKESDGITLSTILFEKTGYGAYNFRLINKCLDGFLPTRITVKCEYVHTIACVDNIEELNKLFTEDTSLNLCKGLIFEVFYDNRSIFDNFEYKINTFLKSIKLELNYSVIEREESSFNFGFLSKLFNRSNREEVEKNIYMINHIDSCINLTKPISISFLIEIYKNQTIDDLRVKFLKMEKNALVWCDNLKSKLTREEEEKEHFYNIIEPSIINWSNDFNKHNIKLVFDENILKLYKNNIYIDTKQLEKSCNCITIELRLNVGIPLYEIAQLSYTIK
jgi:hypothetical protein